MKRLLPRLLPRRIAAQSAAVVVASVLLIHLAMTAYFRFLEGRADDHRRSFVHVGTLVRLAAATPPGEARAHLVADAARTFPSLVLSLSTVAPALAEVDPSAEPERRSGGPGNAGGRAFPDVGSDIRVVDLHPGPPTPPLASGRTRFGDGSDPQEFAFGLSGGEWLRVTETPPPPPPSFLLGPITVSVIFAGLSSLLLGLWAARGLVGPLRDLAAAARDFDIGAEPTPLPRRGPEEIRVAAAAFEAMRRRIRTLVDDRTRMLAAMGHDLRTPITRLRLRAEFVGDDALRDEILRDLAHMTDMIEGALTYLREGRHAEALGLVDLSALIQTVCDQWSDSGRSVDYDGPDHLVRAIRPVAMTRALSNLIDNALKYGTRCGVRLTPRPDGGVVVEVEDDGPGIADADHDAMLQPFVRGDAARNMDDHGGFGLGLAIVKAVVEGHGGRLSLRDAVPHGLIVVIELPPPAVLG